MILRDLTSALNQAYKQLKIVAKSDQLNRDKKNIIRNNAYEPVPAVICFNHEEIIFRLIHQIYMINIGKYTPNDKTLFNYVVTVMLYNNSQKSIHFVMILMIIILIETYVFHYMVILKLNRNKILFGKISLAEHCGDIHIDNINGNKYRHESDCYNRYNSYHIE
eukprot:416940_1